MRIYCFASSRKASKKVITLLEAEAGLQFAAVVAGLIFVYCHAAVGPAQQKIRPKRKNNRLTVDLGFYARSFCGRRQAEVQGPAEDYGIGFANQIARHRANHFRLHQISSGVRPVAHGNIEVTALFGKILQFYFCESARTRDAGNSGVAELIALAGIERDALPISASVTAFTEYLIRVCETVVSVRDSLTES
jgi:hypothetical protein